MSLLDRVRACQNDDGGSYLPFCATGLEIGRIDSEFVQYIAKYSDVFEIDDSSVALTANLRNYEERTQAMAHVLNGLRMEGLIPGWRDEPYPAGPAFNAPPLFEMERAAVPLFGVPGYGVHMNGWLKKDGRTQMWIARRSLTKPTGPGKLDQIVGGGQPVGMSLRDNLIKECGEEAGIPPALAKMAKPVGTLSYTTIRPEGLRNDVLFNFDLYVPDYFEPINQDGEVAEFMLWDIDEVMQRLSDTEDFKFNSALVIIDFLIRHGFIEADDPDYSDIVAGLHR